MTAHPLLDRNTFVTRFGSNEPNHRVLRRLHALVSEVPGAAEDSGRATGEGAVEWLEELVAWLFERGEIPQRGEDETEAHARTRVLLTAAEEIPEFALRVKSSVLRVLGGTSSTLLFADTGIASRLGFWGELFDRVSKNVLPAPPVGRETSRLLSRLVDTDEKVEWALGLPDELRARLVKLLGLDSEEVTRLFEPSQREAMVLLATRIAMQGTSDDLRRRLPKLTVETSPFVALPPMITLLLASELPAARVVQSIAACRGHLDEVSAGLDQTGISIDLVYRLELLQSLLGRLELLVQLRADTEWRALAQWQLARALLRGTVADRSLGALLQSSTRLLARRFVERAGSSGEHYVTRTRTEQQQMLDAAAGGGAITALAVFAKFFISYLHAPPVFDALLIGLNYAWCFVAMQLLHFALATKQPSMTAATIAGAIEAQKEEGNPDLEPLVDLVARASRTQFAALLGNVFVVVPFALSIALVFQAVTGHHVLDDAYAEKTIKVHHPIHSVTIFSAAMTGVWLWAASLLAGAAENWFVVNEMPGAIASNRGLRRLVGPARAARFSRFLTQQASGFGGNVGFAMLLGFMPMLFVLVGVPLEVRHVTFVTGQLAYAAVELGPSVFWRTDFLLALVSVPMVGLINFAVSFAFAIVVALRARGLGVRSQLRLGRAVALRFVKNPRPFFLAPREVAAPVEQVSAATG
ncbi:MAG: gliding motility protein [Myxococcaceae bacterium]